MATVDITGTGSDYAIPWDAHQKGGVVLHKNIKASTIIAGDTTMAAAGKIASGDVLQAIKVPAGFVFTGSKLVTVTPEGSATTADIGIAGGDQIQDGVSLNETAGTVALTLVADDWGPDNMTGYAFTANDTIDFTAKADIEAGEWDLYILGWVV